VIAVVWSLGVVGALLAPVERDSIGAARGARIHDQLEGCTRALQEYAEANDETLPPASHWNGLVGVSDERLVSDWTGCGFPWFFPQPESPYCCALNRFVVERKLDDLDSGTILMTPYLAERPDQVTELPPRLPVEDPRPVTTLAESYDVGASREELIDCLTHNRPLPSLLTGT